VNGTSAESEILDRTAPRGNSYVLPYACLALYLAVVLTLFLAIRHRDDGVFTYTLDDPYIHLALAENLAHGHYGINPGEASSPSSSILWPFLLLPLVGTAWHMYLPLLWNVLFCGMAAWLIGWSIDRWGWPEARYRWLRFPIAVALMLVANLAGLTFVGMEHGLQVLLAVACAAGMAEAFAGRAIPAWSLVAAVLGPMVRYENFALVAAVAIALYGLGRWRATITVFGLSAIGPALFSVFLLAHGLPALPSSVLVKAHIYATHAGALTAAIATVAQNMYWGAREPAWYAQLAVGVALFVLTVREKRRPQRFILRGALVAAVSQLILGRVNWFHRYEVYALIFTTMGACAALAQVTRRPRLLRLILLPCLIAIAEPYLDALYNTPEAASNVYQQQYQMHRFLVGSYRGTVAVNDLGWVSYQRPAGLRVLDLWGLASPEASRQYVKDEAWLDRITKAHAAGLAIVYPDWYKGIPVDWTPLGTMCARSRLESIAQPCVVFYSTAVGDKELLEQKLAAFTQTLPASVKMTLGRDSTGEDE
jgi:hypothetical protein